MNIKKWAWISTGLAFATSLASRTLGGVPALDSAAGLTGLIAIILWVAIYRKWRASRPRLQGTKASARNALPHSQGPLIVRVSYRDLAEPAPNWKPGDLARGYAFSWPFADVPVVGSRVWVPDGDGADVAAVVVGYGTDFMGALRAVSRLATPDEVDASRTSATQDELAWLDLAARAAGLPSSAGALSTPNGYPEIAPVDGAATRSQADTYGRMWWRAYKRAEELGRDAREAQRFSEIAHRWYALRDAGGS